MSRSYESSARKYQKLVASLVLPMALAACGDSDSSGSFSDNDEAAQTFNVPQSNGAVADNLAAQAVDGQVNQSGAIASNGKDQVGTASTPTTNVDIAANKLNDTTNNTASTSTPTEKVDDDTTTTSTTVNSVQNIVEDMQLRNDAPLKGVDPSFGFANGPGFNVMGNNASSSALPGWFTSEFPDLASSGTWNAILPWFVMFEGESNAAGSVKAQMRGLKVFMLSRASNTWIEVIDVADIDGELCPVGDDTTPCSEMQGKASETSGGVSVPVIAGQNLHGWFGDRTQIDGADVQAIFVTMQSRLIGDDLSAAQYLIDVGADYYPSVSSTVPYVPGVGVSRAKLLTGEWQSFNFMTFSDVGQQEPGGGISAQDFASNPPPLD